MSWSVPIATAAAGLAGIFSVVAVCELVRHRLDASLTVGRRGVVGVWGLVAKLKGGEELSRGDLARVILLVFSFCLLFGLFTFGPVIAVVAAPLCSWLSLKLYRWHLQRLRLKVEQELPDLARSLAGSLTGGNSIRGALHQVALDRRSGPLGRELMKINGELEVGLTTEAVLERFSNRLRSRKIDLFVSAILVQRHVGGDLAELMRGYAAAAEDSQKLAQDVRAASSQARFTALLVVLLPLFALLLAELLSPGFVVKLFTSFISLLIVSVSFALQLVGYLVIRKIAQRPLKGI